MYVNLRYKQLLILCAAITMVGLTLPLYVLAQVSQKHHKTLRHHYTAEEMSHLLGWVEVHSELSSMESGYCQGYYKNSPTLRLPDSQLTQNKEAFVHFKADQSLIQPRRGRSYLQGHAQVYQKNRTLSSDYATLIRDKKTHKISQVDLKGHVRLELPGRLVIADQAHVNPDSTLIRSMLYRLLRADRSYACSPGNKNRLDVWGQAEKGVMDHKGILHLKKATYTTCPPTTHTWYLSAINAHLNPKEGWGQAYHTTLVVHDVPVLYLPFISFPLDGRRKTGLLLPSFAHSDKGGFELRLPVYWNIAPNTDLTFTPSYIERRGPLFDWVWRYLFPSHQGSLHLMFLPNDEAFKRFRLEALSNFSSNPNATLGLSRLRDSKASRGGLSFKHRMKIEPHWSGGVDVNLASDDYLLFDINTLLGTEELFHLRNSADIHYADQHWNLSGLVLAYQTLHPVNQNFVEDLYSQTPRLNATGYYSLFHNAIDLTLHSEWVYFDHKSNPLTSLPFVTGNRFTLHPILTAPLYWQSGFIRSQLEGVGTYYTLKDQLPSRSSEILQALPLFSIDAGLYLDRYFRWNKLQYRQTLEPRLFYLLVPLHNQDDIPIFDTEVLPFSFEELFRTQRFVGVDRLGDAHQLSMGLTSRVLRNDTGEEQLRTSLGVIYYFHRHRVCLEPDCRRDPTAKNTFSPIVGTLRYHLTRRWQIISALAWDPSRHRTNNGYLNVLYRGPEERTVYLTYQYIQNGQQSQDTEGLTEPQSNNLGRVSVALSWPLGRKWSLLLSSSYNSVEGYQQAYYYGLQYNSCCWAMRFLSHNVFNAKRKDRSNEFQHRYYLQIQLKGLSNIGGNDPGRLLEETIPGYRNLFK